MFEKILICTDTSPGSDLLIQCAGELKPIGMEAVVLGHVLQAAHTEGLDQRLAMEALPLLHKQKEALERLGIGVIMEMPLGRDPARTLAELADHHDVSAILIGSHGKGVLRAATLGSVSSGILHETRRPVLLARITLLEDGKCGLVCGKMFTRALFATDFSETSEHALNCLGGIASQTKCPVTIMHVIEEKPDDAAAAERLKEDARFLIESKKRRLESLGGVDVSTELSSGGAAKEILARAQKGDFSIIVMGSRGKGVVKEVLLGSVSNEVVRNAELPVLLIPPVR